VQWSDISVAIIARHHLDGDDRVQRIEVDVTDEHQQYSRASA
jgi:hypothetical protein